MTALARMGALLICEIRVIRGRPPSVQGDDSRHRRRARDAGADGIVASGAPVLAVPHGRQGDGHMRTACVSASCRGWLRPTVVMVRFQWDPRKAAANRRKHGVRFEEAATVFADPLARIRDDHPDLSAEPREVIVGRSVRQRLLVVCYRERDGVIRLISARPATRRERADYEEATSD